jgi:hypothetical protein
VTIEGTLGNQGASALVQRACSVTVGIPGSSQGLAIQCGNGTGLDVSFRIQRSLHVTQSSLKPIPNTCDLRIFGLSATHRKQLAKSTTTPGPDTVVVPCILAAGYQQNQKVLFSGELRGAQDISEGPNVIVELSTGDGDAAITQTRLNLVVPAGATMSQVFQQIVDSMGVQSGNLQSALGQFQSSPQAARLFAKGAALKGSAAEILSDMCRSVGIQWSIQNGAIQILPVTTPPEGQAILIDENHGMVGTPTVDTKGIAVVRTLMIPGIIPGSKIALSSRNASGGFTVIGMEIEGDTSPGSTTWGYTLNCERY